MKQIYAITLIFLPFWGFSQLHIQPYHQQDSYLYVQGEVLYVTQDINLQLNPSLEERASIYLRDEGQLIQGDENIKNTGNGLLSVFQEGKASVHTYNYWGSPVEHPGTNAMFGEIFFDPAGKTYSTPALITREYNGSAKPLTISNRWIYTLSGREYGDWSYVGQNFNIMPGEGFTMKGVQGTNTEIVLYGVANNPGNEQRYDFRGRPYTGTLGLDIHQDEILLVGNPYPSALDLNAFLLDNKNTTGIAYFWDSKMVSSHYLNDYEGGYGAYSPVLGDQGYVPAVFSSFDQQGNPTHFTGDSGSYYARRFCPIAQGFVVEGLKNGRVLFKNKYREFMKENLQTSQFKTATPSSKSAEAVAYVRLNIRLHHQYVRQLLLAFHPEATPGIDQAMDAKNIMPLETDAGWLLEENPFLIYAIPWDETVRVPLVINTSIDSDVSFSLAAFNNLDRAIYLLDDHTGIYYNLFRQEVDFNLPAGEFGDRFFIVFLVDEQEGEHLEEPSQNQYQVYQNNFSQRAEITSPLNMAPQHIALYDITGKRIYSISGKVNQDYYELPTSKLSKGVYIIKINSADGTVITKKVIIYN